MEKMMQEMRAQTEQLGQKLDKVEHRLAWKQKEDREYREELRAKKGSGEQLSFRDLLAGM